MKEINLEFKIPSFKISGSKKFRSKPVLSAVIVIGALAAGQIFEYTFLGALILAYFGLALLWKLSSRLAASAALLFLAGCPILLIFKEDALAETFAIYAYYFLVIVVIQEILIMRGRK